MEPTPQAVASAVSPTSSKDPFLCEALVGKCNLYLVFCVLWGKCWGTLKSLSTLPCRVAENKGLPVLPSSCGLRPLGLSASEGNSTFMNQKLQQEKSGWDVKTIRKTFLCPSAISPLPTPWVGVTVMCGYSAISIHLGKQHSLLHAAI